LPSVKLHASHRPFKRVWLLKYALGNLKFQLAYTSRYKTAWLWLRGYNKQQWINTLLEIYGTINVDCTVPAAYQDTALFHPPLPGHWEPSRLFRAPKPLSYGDTFLRDPQMYRLAKMCHLTWSWLVVLAVTGILIVVPFVLACLMAWSTPPIGLACRSFTFVLYLATQVLQISMLLIAYKHGRTASYAQRVVWYYIAAFFGAAAIFTAIGGTMMQLMGVYSQCRCHVPITYWLDMDNPNVWIAVGVNSALDILEARLYWRACGFSAVGFLGVLSYVSRLCLLLFH
jgi:hypothetical protein